MGRKALLARYTRYSCSALVVAFLNCVIVTIGTSAAAVPVVNVKLPGGIFQGEVSFQGTQRPVATFRGIPYAAPPTGDLRWRPPEHPKPWRPRILRSSHNPGCVQVKHDTPHGRIVGDEDCLVMSVFAPHPMNTSAKLPVLFWIHGGGYQVGSGSGVDSDGSYNVGNLDAPMIIVVINYRLNVFGFAASDVLRCVRE